MMVQQRKEEKLSCGGTTISRYEVATSQIACQNIILWHPFLLWSSSNEKYRIHTTCYKNRRTMSHTHKSTADCFSSYKGNTN